MTPRGSNNPLQALTFAFRQRPQAIYFITSGPVPNMDAVHKLVTHETQAAKVAIHTVLFNSYAFVKDPRNSEFVNSLERMIRGGGRWNIGTGPPRDFPGERATTRPATTAENQTR